jgi:hypothetical protein
MDGSENRECKERKEDKRGKGDERGEEGIRTLSTIRTALNRSRKQSIQRLETFYFSGVDEDNFMAVGGWKGKHDWNCGGRGGRHGGWSL